MGADRHAIDAPFSPLSLGAETMSDQRKIQPSFAVTCIACSAKNILDLHQTMRINLLRLLSFRCIVKRIPLRRRNHMSKGLDKKKDTKKKPAKTLMEKRAEKRAKRASKG